MIVTITKEFKFEASHILPRHPGKCSRLHGHSWVGQASITGSVDPATGFVMDYGELKGIIDEHIVDVLDHRHLGYGDMADGQTVETAAVYPDFYPSSENLVVWIAERLRSAIQDYRAANEGNFWLSGVELKETCTSRASIYLSIAGYNKGVDNG